MRKTIASLVLALTMAVSGVVAAPAHAAVGDTTRCTKTVKFGDGTIIRASIMQNAARNRFWTNVGYDFRPTVPGDFRNVWVTSQQLSINDVALDFEMFGPWPRTDPADEGTEYPGKYVNLTTTRHVVYGTAVPKLSIYVTASAHVGNPSGTGIRTARHVGFNC